MEPNRSRDQFNRQAANYDRQWNQWNEENLRWLLDRGRVQATERLLDVATGAGFTALAFAPFVAEVVGIDVSPGMLGQAKKNAAGVANATFQEAAAEAIPFADGSFDVVTCRIAAHHFQSVPRFLAESYRVLRPGGRILIADTCVPDNDPELDRWQNEVELLRDPSHMRNYAPAEWRAFLEAAGFRVEETTSEGGCVPITFADWLKKSGCTGDPAARLRELFESASPAARSAFRIEHTADGDVAFAWLRVLIRAAK